MSIPQLQSEKRVKIHKFSMCCKPERRRKQLETSTETSSVSYWTSSTPSPAVHFEEPAFDWGFSSPESETNNNQYNPYPSSRRPSHNQYTTSRPLQSWSPPTAHVTPVYSRRPNFYSTTQSLTTNRRPQLYSSTSPYFHSTTPSYSTSAPHHAEQQSTTKSSRTFGRNVPKELEPIVSWLGEKPAVQTVAKIATGIYGMASSSAATAVETADATFTTLFPESCGISYHTKIVGGVDADPKKWHWMVALIKLRNNEKYCGGVLISDQHVLTAAHCLRRLTPLDIIVRLGAYDFSSSADEMSADHRIQEFRIHPDYDRYTHSNDLALLKLEQKASFSDHLRPICLPQGLRDYFGSIGTVIGFGSTLFNGPSSDRLRQVSLPVWNNTMCQSVYGEKIVSDRILCAGHPNGGKDSCQVS